MNTLKLIVALLLATQPIFAAQGYVSGPTINTTTGKVTQSWAGTLIVAASSATISTAAITLAGPTGSVTATTYYGDGSHLSGISVSTASGGVTLLGGLPVGSIISYSSGTVPASWLECNGASLSTVTYSDLYAADGCTWGCADSSHFNLPDFRGVFPRGWNHSVSSSAYIGDTDATTRAAIATGGQTGDNVGSYESSTFTAHTHSYTKPTPAGANGGVTAAGFAGPTGTSSQNTISAGGLETRPKNANVMFIIKYQDTVSLSGALTVASSVTASAFFGDGSHLSNLNSACYYDPSSVTGVVCGLGPTTNNATGSYGTTSGGYTNHSSGGYDTIGGGFQNLGSGAYTTISGGRQMTVSADYGYMGGGFSNSCSQTYCVIGGGSSNQCTADHCYVGGGTTNFAQGANSVISGGDTDIASNVDSTVGGGNQNTASGVGSTVPGGSSNTASGDYSFAAGLRANASAKGSFVWADSQNAALTSSIKDQFDIRAQGGTVFTTSSMTITGLVIISSVSSPASGAACTAGSFIWDASFLYLCTASGAWKRAALTGGY